MKTLLKGENEQWMLDPTDAIKKRQEVGTGNHITVSRYDPQLNGDRWPRSMRNGICTRMSLPQMMQRKIGGNG